VSVGRLLAANVRELRNGLRRDPRRRALLVFGLAVQLGLGLWGAVRLAPALARWQEDGGGAIERGLWPLCAALWTTAAANGWLSHCEWAFGDRARLLFTLPIGRAGRARILVGQCAFQLASGFGIGLLPVLAALAHGLGWSSLEWIALALAGAGAALWVSLIVQMGFAALPPAWRRWMALGLVLAFAAGIAALGVVAALAQLHLLPLPPAWGGAIVAAGVLGLLAGPLAPWAGGLYEQAFFLQEAGSARSRPRRILRFLTRGLARWRGPAGALLVREILLRGRHPIEWLRFGAFAGSLVLLFPWLRPVLAANGLPGALGVVTAIVATALFYVFDGSTSPLGAEGSRLLHYLTVPLSLRTLLRTKFIVLYAPLLCGAVAGVAALAARSSLSIREALWAFAATALVLLGAAILFALGSVWDADLNLEIESGLRGFVQETAPTTPVRMLLFVAASGVAAAEIGLLVVLGPRAGLAAVAALDGLLLLALLPPAEDALRRQLRAG